MALIGTDTGRASNRGWMWTLGWAAVTIALAILAFFLPDIDWMPKGGLVGWLLLAAGMAESAFGAGRGRDRFAITAMVAGLLSAMAGLLFVTNPLASYLSVANVVMLWLALRGLWVLAISFSPEIRHTWALVGLSGIVDLLLALVLAAGLPVALLVVTLFGPTPAIVAQFSLIFATSFLVTGMTQATLAFTQRHQVIRGPRSRS